MGGVKRGADGVVDSSVVGGGVTLGEVVGLDTSIITTSPFPVNLVEIVRLKNNTGDDTSTLGSLNDDIKSAEHEVVV